MEFIKRVTKSLIPTRKEDESKVENSNSAPQLQPMPGSNLNTGPTSPSNSQSGSWPFPGSQNAPVAPSKPSEPLPKLPATHAPGVWKPEGKKIVDLPVQSEPASPPALVPKVKEGPPALEPITKPVAEGVPPLQRIGQEEPIAAESNAPVVDSNVEALDAAAATAGTITPPPLEPIGDASLLEPVPPPLEVVRGGIAVAEIPPLLTIPRDIHAYVVHGHNHDSVTYDLCGIYMGDVVQRLPGTDLAAKLIFLCNSKFEALKAVRAMGDWATVPVSIGAHHKALGIECLVNVLAKSENQDDPDDSNNTFVAYTFTVIKYKLNDLGTNLNLNSIPE